MEETSAQEESAGERQRGAGLQPWQSEGKVWVGCQQGQATFRTGQERRGKRKEQAEVLRRETGMLARSGRRGMNFTSTHEIRGAGGISSWRQLLGRERRLLVVWEVGLERMSFRVL